MTENEYPCQQHGVHVVEERNPHVCADCGQQFCPDCGRDLDSFACKVRHVSVNTANLRRERER